MDLVNKVKWLQIKLRLMRNYRRKSLDFKVSTCSLLLSIIFYYLEQDIGKTILKHQSGMIQICKNPRSWPKHEHIKHRRSLNII